MHCQLRATDSNLVFLVCWSSEGWEDGYERDQRPPAPAQDVGTRTRSRLTSSRYRLLARLSAQSWILWDWGNYWSGEFRRGETGPTQNYQDRGRWGWRFPAVEICFPRLPSRLLTSPSWTPPTWPRCTGRWRWWSWWTIPTLWSSTKSWRPRACFIWCRNTRPGEKYLVSNSIS